MMQQLPSVPSNLMDSEPSSQPVPVDLDEVTRDLLMEDSAERRAAAVHKLATLGAQLASPYLSAALFDSSVQVRQAATESLGRVGGSAAIASLRDLLASEVSGGVSPQVISDAINSITAREADLSAPSKVEAEQLQRMKEAESTLRAQKEAQEQFEIKLRRVVNEHTQRLAELETVRSQAEAEAQARAQTEQHLNSEIQALRKAEEEQLRRIELAKAARHEREEARNKAETEARRRAIEERDGLAQLESTLKAAEAEAQERAVEAQRVRAEIQSLSKVASEQIDFMEAAKIRLMALEEARNRAEMKVRQRALRGERLAAEAESLRQSERTQLETEALARAEEEEKHLAALEAIRNSAELETQQRAELVQQLEAGIAALRKAEARQLEQIAVAEAETRERAIQEECRIAELEALRSKAAAEAQQRAERERQISAEIEIIQKLEAEQLKGEVEALQNAESKRTGKIEKLQARRSQAEAEARLLDEQEAQLLAELESIRGTVESKLEALAQKELSINARIEALRKAESIQLKRLEKVEGKLRAEEESRQQTGARGGSRNAKSQTTNLKARASKAASGVEGEKELVARLEAIRTETKLEAEQLTKKERLLQSKIEELCKAELEQLARIEEAKARLHAQEEKQRTHAEEESRLVAKLNGQAPEAETENRSEAMETEAPLDDADYLVQAEKGIQASSDAASRICAISEILKSGDPSSRADALKELEELGEDEAFNLITNLFDDESADVRNSAARVLYEFQPDRAAAFTRALREGSAERCRKIAAALDGSGLAEKAISSLAGESREKTYDAFSILFLMAKAGEVQTLLNTIANHPSVPVRLSVIKLLTFSNQAGILPAFRSLAVKGSLPTEVRSALMESIYQISNNSRDNTLSAA